ncbi:DUF4339 domain-containing protein [Pedobacter lithocola]|uniref:DUF4339 domain-containing protein n=1 Tax=Pedobacter lithocola TaxID=1908239 RepID=A0ABV8P5A7_9SPHI
MNKYYISKGLKKLGPFSLNELGNHKIYSKTLVWKDSNSDWKEAKEIPELNTLIKLIPPSRGLKSIKVNNAKKCFLMALLVSAIMFLVVGGDATDAVIFKLNHREELNSENADDKLEYFMRRDFGSFIVYKYDSMFNGIPGCSSCPKPSNISVSQTLDKAITETIIDKSTPTFFLVFVITFLVFYIPFYQYFKYFSKRLRL